MANIRNAALFYTDNGCDLQLMPSNASNLHTKKYHSGNLHIGPLILIRRTCITIQFDPFVVALLKSSFQVVFYNIIHKVIVTDTNLNLSV